MAASDGPGTDLQIFGNVWYPFVVNVNMSINFIRLQIIDRLLYRELIKFCKVLVQFRATSD